MTLPSGQAIDITEDEFFQGVNPSALIQSQGLALDPRFLQAVGFQQPRQLRLGIRFSF